MITTKMILVTPEMAAEMLKKNCANRQISDNVVLYYAEQMKSGQWLSSPQTISFTEEGELIDGQHRLTALIRANVNIYFNVAINVPFENFKVLDNGRKRTLGDVMHMEKIPSAKKVASIITSYYALKKGWVSRAGFSSSTNSSPMAKSDLGLTNQTAIDIYNKNPELWHEITKVSEQCYSRLRIFTGSQIGAIAAFLILEKIHQKHIVFSFLKQLFFNENVENKSIYYLREKLINSTVGNVKLVSAVKLIYLIKCWNAFVKGKEIKNYQFNQNDTRPEFI